MGSNDIDIFVFIYSKLCVVVDIFDCVAMGLSDLIGVFEGVLFNA